MTASNSFIALATTWALAGFVFGFIYFAVLRRTVHLFAGGRGRLLPAVLTLGRLAAAVLFLGLAARYGTVTLLIAFLGFLLARALALRAARRIA